VKLTCVQSTSLLPFSLFHFSRDSAALTNQASDFKKFGYVLPGHEQQSVEVKLSFNDSCVSLYAWTRHLICDRLRGFHWQ